jgi:hypothetical protein
MKPTRRHRVLTGAVAALLLSTLGAANPRAQQSSDHQGQPPAGPSHRGFANNVNAPEDFITRFRG